MDSVKLPETNCLEQGKGKSDSSVCTSVSASAVAAPAEQQPSENGVKRLLSRKTRHGISKLNDLPCRASKRLAGIKVGITSELRTTSRACRVADKQSGEAEASSSENVKNLATPEEHIRKAEVEENRTDEKQKCPIILPLENSSIPKEHVGEVETDNNDDDKPGSPIGLSLTDSWMEVDPCIEFAIKTLTGAIPIGNENRADENPSIHIDLPPDNQGSSLDLPFGDSWTDPCIEFAIKTLKGEIPVDDNLQLQNYFQKQLSSSNSQGRNGSTIPNVSLHNDFSQAHLSPQQFHTAERPLYKQQAR
ncbi:unnamed protein product [Ilex paraguariensis]|uniref:Uncharacterized protein n=1 Tax=Ilex paraguariensis TaxID=185542 RepID=A0ABC8TJA7_9AQUA